MDRSIAIFLCCFSAFQHLWYIGTQTFDATSRNRIFRAHIAAHNIISIDTILDYEFEWSNKKLQHARMLAFVKQILTIFCNFIFAMFLFLANKTICKQSYLFFFSFFFCSCVFVFSFCFLTLCFFVIVFVYFFSFSFLFLCMFIFFFYAFFILCMSFWFLPLT